MGHEHAVLVVHSCTVAKTEHSAVHAALANGAQARDNGLRFDHLNLAFVTCALRVTDAGTVVADTMTAALTWAGLFTAHSTSPSWLALALVVSSAFTMTCALQTLVTIISTWT